MVSQSSASFAFLKGSLISIFFVSALYVSGLYAGVYKWTDEQGRVHYSDRPVSGTSTEVKIKQPPPAEGDNSSSPQQRQDKMRRMLDAYEEERSNKREAKQEAKKEREQRKKKCIYAKDRYNSHNRATGIYNYDKEGERRYMNDSQRQAHMQKLKAEVERWCK
jgi:hypothetical protein